MPGTIILLNGTVSAGKTSIARALQDIMEPPYLHLGGDILGDMCPPSFAGGRNAAGGFAWVPVPHADPPETALIPGPFGHFLVKGLHQAVAALSGMGHNVVVDHGLQEPRWRRHCIRAWRDLPVYLVGVRCALAVAEQRERQRRNRVNGVARWQFDRVHTGMRYDQEVDTARQTSMECAEAIKESVLHLPQSTAFHQLAAQLGADLTGA